MQQWYEWGNNDAKTKGLKLERGTTKELVLCLCEDVTFLVHHLFVAS